MISAAGLVPHDIQRESRVSLETTVMADDTSELRTPQFAVVEAGGRPTSWRPGRWKSVAGRKAIAVSALVRPETGMWTVWVKVTTGNEEYVTPIGTLRVR